MSARIAWASCSSIIYDQTTSRVKFLKKCVSIDCAELELACEQN